MNDKHLIIIGGGLAGLSAGCYAQRNGYRTTIIEHNLALGGVCTAWERGPYTIDGCIHWLTGGPFQAVYEELEILPTVACRVLDKWLTYRDAQSGIEVTFGSDLDALVTRLSELSPVDGPELQRLRKGARDMVTMELPMTPGELLGPTDALRMAWGLRDTLGTLVHFRKPVGTWAREHLHSPTLQRIFTSIMPETTPTLFLLMVLGYLERGYLSRPVGGTGAFRDQLVRTYRGLGGEALMHATVDELLVRDGRATGVRLADGTMRMADAVISTASAPETVLRLLGGRYDAEPTRERLANWKLFDPIVLASFGVAQPYKHMPQLLMLDRVTPLEVGGRKDDLLYVRVCNDDPCFAPAGHTVIQVMVPTTYDFWATQGSRYGVAKEAIAEALLARLELHFPELKAGLRMTDVATPLTYWGMARSWRGAYEGWMPNEASLFSRVRKKLAHLDGFYMAGQWVEPGGGVPTAVLSGRQAVQLMCDDAGRPFTATG